MEAADFNELQKENISRWPVVYKILAWIHAVGMTLVIVPVIVLILTGRRTLYSGPFHSIPYLQSFIVLLFLVGCFGAILNRPRASARILVTGVWFLSQMWYQIISICREFTLWYSPEIEFNFSNRTTVLYAELSVAVVKFLLMAIFIFSAYYVSCKNEETPESEKHHKLSTSQVLILGLTG